jgi:hypothetical protein
MATFNVFVEGPVDETPTALPELAEAMSQRYGIPAADLVARLKRGRFRVKSNLDATAAERYRQDLASIGARVLVENSALSPTATPVAGTPIMRATTPPPVGLAAAGPQHARPSTPPPTRTATPAHGTTVPPSNRPSTPPSALAGYARPSTPPPIASSRPSTPIPSDMISGLSAGFGDAAQADLGALGDGALSLASLDGHEAPAASNQFETALPPEEKPAVSFAPPKPKSPDAPRKKPGPSKPMDLFAPPDAGDQDLVVDFAVDEKEDRAAKRASAPPEDAPAAATTRRTPVTMQAAEEPAYGASAPPRQFSRANFVAAVVVALAVGFIPAHFVANMREKSAFAAIDNQVAAAHASADSHETYAALDGARDKLLDDKQSERTMIALTSMLLWAVLSAGVAFALLRYTPKKKS